MDDTASAALNTTVFIALVALAVVLGYSIRTSGFRYATEGSIALLLGAIAGGAIITYYALIDPQHRLPTRLITFDEDLIFQTLLPPIIFAAGFSVKKKLFFQNFGTLLLLGVGGTLATAGVLAAVARPIMARTLAGRSSLRNALALGAVLSCTDSVASLQLMDPDRAPLLYALLFGEGVVNDATAIVLLGATMELPYDPDTETWGLASLGALLTQFLRLFVLSTALGLAVGLASAALVRHLFTRPSAGPETLTLALLGLLAYFAAEALGLSAILSVFFCGIAMSHYTWHNLSPPAKVLTRHGFHVISSACEVVLFVYAGLDMWVSGATWWRMDTSRYLRMLGSMGALAGGMLAAMAAARAAVVFPVAALANAATHGGCSGRGRAKAKEENGTQAEHAASATTGALEAQGQQHQQRQHAGARRAKRSMAAHDRIPPGGAAVLWWGGLPRGAITLGLTYHSFWSDAATRPEQRVIIGACIIVVFTTTVGFGVVTQHVMELLMPTPPPPQPPPQRPQQLQQHAAKRNSAGRQGGALRPAGYGRQSGPADVDVRQPLLSPCGSSSELTQPCASNGVHGVQGPTSVIPTAAAAAAAVVAAVAAAEVSAPPAAALGATMAVVSSAPPLELSNDMLWAGEVLGVPAVPRVAAGAGSATADMGATGGAGAGTAAAPVQGGGDVGHGAGGVGGGAEATLLGMEDLDEERTWVHRQWRRFDATWLQPVFGGRRAGEGIAGLEHV